jgi:outer membrane protein OmpA-like peptidoglycan-associated protein
MKTSLLLLALVYAGLAAAQPAPLFDSLKIAFSDTLYFSSGSNIISQEALQKTASFPSPAHETDKVYLTAHTDAIGNTSYNDALADRRAQSAKEQLKLIGWNENQIVIRTFGERRPVAANEYDRGRQLNRRVTLDLYKAVPYVKINGRAVDPQGNGIRQATVRLHGRTLSDTLYTDEEGRFAVNLPVDSVVGIDVYAKNYFLSTQMIRVKPSINQDLRIAIAPAEIGAIADIANLYYAGNQAVLLPQSEPELPKLKLFMEINPHLIVEIAGHVNVPNTPPISKENPSWDLSLRRAKMVYDYLIAEGIPAEQLSYQAYGNHEMRFPNARTEKDQAANRRVEIRVMGTLPSEH